ncbi:hypothetical protein fugu_017180 [Takifugu bimaculatus]|uniref:E2F-associated phosphoprotein n=1 Tax=Takifugu bimaculatus TaxID=433685 RepID=A0A4Z2BW54_9TELE|nr:hypothetical protein fugu_017180 [Takifugu bimaculatus]
MEAELSSTIKTMEGTWGPPATEEPGGGGGSLRNARMYDEVYFDSDSEEEDKPGSSTGRRQKQRIIKSNDELLYDPDEDDRDQAWVDARRRRYNGRNRGAVSGSKPHPRHAQALPSSDAILNCPACMTTLCLDCQRHEKYRTQYRAMFVMNCTVKPDEVLRYQTKSDRKQRNRKRRKVETTPEEAAELTPAGDGRR